MKEIQFDLLGKHFSVKTDDPDKLERTISDLKKFLRDMSLEYKSLDLDKFLLFCMLKMTDQMITIQDQLAQFNNQIDTIDIDSFLDE
ncbi:cell division protein ZapA [bacterium]|nr:cell division protein ZapA [bacterium]